MITFCGSVRNVGSKSMGFGKLDLFLNKVFLSFSLFLSLLCKCRIFKLFPKGIVDGGVMLNIIRLKLYLKSIFYIQPHLPRPVFKVSFHVYASDSPHVQNYHLHIINLRG